MATLTVVLCFLSVLAIPVSSAEFQSWQERRDAGVVKQRLDNSCGLSALATLLQRRGHREVSEMQLIQALEDSSSRLPDDGYTLDDLRWLASGFGYRGIGMRVDIALIAALKQPVIALLNLPRGAHFTVIIPSNNEWVHLADPSWGNRHLQPHQFADLWLDRQGRGLILALVTEA